MKIDFDPNTMSSKKKIKVYEFATYIPDRRPEFKAHLQISHAKNAFLYRDSGILYKLIDGNWKELYRIEDWKAPDFCDECGKGLVEYPEWYHGKPYRRGHRMWMPKEEYLIYVCRECERRLKGI